MKQLKLDLAVGFFVLLGILTLVFFSMRVANLVPKNPESVYPIQAEFTNIGGLKVGTPVKIAGVLVGRVTQITLDPKTFNAKVTLMIDKQYQLSQDVAAEILTSGLLGEQYISLTQGAEESYLTSGDTIQITSSALVIEQLIGKFMTGFSSSEKENESPQ
jgi:phospholipid/cholesterol/gamma-HCH transport system substrate-binding protein